MTPRRFPPPWSVEEGGSWHPFYSPSTRRLCSSRISSAMFVLTLHRLLAGSNRVAAAHRGTLQCVNHVLRYLPLFVALEILGHVVQVVLLLGQRQFKDPLGFPDQCQSSLNFLAARIVHARPPSEMDSLSIRPRRSVLVK